MPAIQIIMIAFFVSLLFFATHLTAVLLGNLYICVSGRILEEVLSLDHIWLCVLHFAVHFIFGMLCACAERLRDVCILYARCGLWRYLFCVFICVL